MYQVSPNEIYTATDRLLYNIWQELSAINAKLTPPTAEEVAEVVPNEFVCPHPGCGKSFPTNMGLLAHSRKHKKEGD